MLPNESHDGPLNKNLNFRQSFNLIIFNVCVSYNCFNAFSHLRIWSS